MQAWKPSRRHKAQGSISDDCYRQANGDAPLPRCSGLGEEGRLDEQWHVDGRGLQQGNRQAGQIDLKRPALAAAFEQLTQAEGLARHPELMGAYRELTAKRAEGPQRLPQDKQTQAAHLEGARGDIQGRLSKGRIPSLPPIVKPTQARIATVSENAVAPKFEPTLPGNPNRFVVQQHIFPRSAIQRFAASDGCVEVKRFASGTFRVKPTSTVFCAQRAWDQTAETTRSAPTEQAYAALARRIVLGEVQSLTDGMQKVVAELYLLWNHRFGVAQLPAEDLTLNLVAPERLLTKEQEEVLEGKGVMFIRGDRVPIRFINGMTIMRETDRGMAHLAHTRWGIVRSSQGEFLVPDNTKALAVVPLSPNICLVGDAPDQELPLALVGDVNRQLRDCAESYYFAHDLRLCPITRRTVLR